MESRPIFESQIKKLNKANQRPVWQCGRFKSNIVSKFSNFRQVFGDNFGRNVEIVDVLAGRRDWLESLIEREREVRVEVSRVSRGF